MSVVLYRNSEYSRGEVLDGSKANPAVNSRSSVASVQVQELSRVKITCTASVDLHPAELAPLRNIKAEASCTLLGFTVLLEDTTADRE